MGISQLESQCEHKLCKRGMADIPQRIYEAMKKEIYMFDGEKHD
jgi:hypothetical protein